METLSQSLNRSPSDPLQWFWKRRAKRSVLAMIVSQNMVAETEIICQKSIPMLDVKYHLCVAQEHGVKVEVSPTANVVPIFGHVRVAAESVSTETTRFESVGTTGFPFLDFWIVFLMFRCEIIFSAFSEIPSWDLVLFFIRCRNWCFVLFWYRFSLES